MSTYEPIASQTLGSAAASVTFSSIPQGYTDLVLVVTGTITVSDTSISLRFNNDTGNDYSSTFIYGDGSSAVSGRNTSQTNLPALGRLGNTTIGNAIVQIQNYSNATTNKTVLGRGGVTSSTVFATVGLWRDTSAITSIVVAPEGFSGSFNSGSTFSLYGIQVGQAAQKAQGGNIVTSDGTYVYHTFTSSGAFIPSQGLTVDYLVVAGGGGGGTYLAGGGGAGGLRSTVTATGGGGSLESALSLSAGKSYPVIVGAGGNGAPSQTNNATAGNSSVFSTITSTGGAPGPGYAAPSANGVTGGSGSGGRHTGTGGAGTANQGYAGGNGYSVGSVFAGGGGGGANAVGGNGSGSSGGAGGAGVATSITGSSVTYAGGGGGSGGWTSGANAGGAGGAGGGGAGAYNTNATAGTANTGGGGGATSNDAGTNNGGNGGSGIVIIRYAI